MTTGQNIRAFVRCESFRFGVSFEPDEFSRRRNDLGLERERPR